MKDGVLRIEEGENEVGEETLEKSGMLMRRKEKILGKHKLLDPIVALVRHLPSNL